MEKYTYEGKTRIIEVTIIPMQNAISGADYFILYEIETSHGGNRKWEHDSIVETRNEVEARLRQLADRAGVEIS